MPEISVNSISWNLPDGSNLFNNITFTLPQLKTGLTGTNGIGKSTLVKIIAGELKPSSGTIKTDLSIGYLPQDLSRYNNMSTAGVFGAEDKLKLLNKILSGNGTEKDIEKLDGAWDTEERLQGILDKYDLGYIDFYRSVESLSGGERVRLITASLIEQNPGYFIFDEPTNHLDFEAKEEFYKLIEKLKGMLVISHDRQLLRLMDRTAEFSSLGIKIYGGNYDFYLSQKEIEESAVKADIANAESELKKTLKTAEEIMQKQQKRMKTGAKRGVKAGLPKIVLNTLAGKGESTASKLKNLHAARIEAQQDALQNAKNRAGLNRKIDIDMVKSVVPGGKVIVKAEKINYSYDGITNVWKNDVDFLIKGNDRIALTGRNGWGKTTLVKIIRGEIIPSKGSIYTGSGRIGYLDQHTDMLDSSLTLLENIRRYSGPNLTEHELRIRLGRFLFYKEQVFKKVNVLSGGERIRAGLACLLAARMPPDLIILDEPTNNIDLNSTAELTCALNSYTGALLIISHDIDFLTELGM